MRLHLVVALLFLAAQIPNAVGQEKKADSLFVAAQEAHRRAMDLLKQGEKSQALKTMYQATDLFREYQDSFPNKADSIRPVFESLLKKEPQSPVYNYLVARTLLTPQADTAARSKARRYLERAFDIDSSYAWPYMGFASLYITKGDYAGAARYYEKAVRADSTFDIAYSYLVGAYERMGKGDEAVKLRHMLVQRDSTSETGSFSLVDLARRSNDAAEKQDLYWKAIRLTKTDWVKQSAYRELMWLLSKENPDSADALARRVLSSEIGKDRAVRQTAYLTIFENLKRTGRDKIPAFAEEVLAGTDPSLAAQVGWFCLDSLQNVPLALKCLQRAYQVCTKENVGNRIIFGSNIPDERLEQVASSFRSGFIARTLGWAYYQTRDYADAEKYLKESVPEALKGTYPIALYKLGYTLQAEGKKEEAIEWLAKGLAIKYDKQAMEALEKLLAETHSKQTAEYMISAERQKGAEPAIDFKLASLRGDSVQLSKFRGKVVMIDFWATWCGPCVSELPNLVKLYSKYSRNPNVVFLSIDANEPSSVIKPFMEKNNYAFTVLLGNLTDVVKSYGVEGIPTKFLIDRSGRIQFKHVGGGPDPKVIDELSKEIDKLLASTEK
jgi:tetratricopeptide (TPR) repeat protein